MPAASSLSLDRSVDALNPNSPPRVRHTVEQVGEWPTGPVNWARSLRNPLWADPIAGSNDKYIGSNPRNPNVYGDSHTAGVRPATASTRRAQSPIDGRRPRSGTADRVQMRADSDGLNRTYLLPDAYERDTFGLPRPSTAGTHGRRSSAGHQNKERPATAGSHSRAARAGKPASMRSGTGDSRTSSHGGSSTVGSNGSNASNMSFLDRFTAADRREQKLLMMQKKEEVNDALVKRAQIDGIRPFTPELVREVAEEVDRVVNPDAMMKTWEGTVGVAEEETEAEAQILNHEGTWSFSEVVSAQALAQQTASLGSRTVGSRTQTGSRSRSRTRSRGASGKFAPESTSSQWEGTDVTPWRRSASGKKARESMVSAQSRAKGGVVMTLWDRLRSTTTRAEILGVLREQPTIGPMDGGCCTWKEFEQAMLLLTLRLSIVECKWLKHEFSTHQDGVPGAMFSYRSFLDTFWPADGRTPQQLSQPRRRAALDSLLAKLAAQMTEHTTKSGSDVPAALQLLEAMQRADPQRSGKLHIDQLTVTLGSLGLPVSHDAEALQLFVDSQFTNSNSEDRDPADKMLMDYRAIVQAAFPAQLTLTRPLRSKSSVMQPAQAVNAGHGLGTDISVSSGSATEAATFHDVVEKVKQQCKGNRSILQKCFTTFDRSATGVLELPQICQALRLLRIGLSMAAASDCFRQFITRQASRSAGQNALVDYKRLLIELFPPSATLQQASVSVAEVNLLHRQITEKLQQRWSTLLLAFRALDSDHDGVLNQAEFGSGVRSVLALDPQPEVMSELWKRWDINGSGEIEFDEFSRLVGSEHSGTGLLVRSHDVKQVQDMIRENIEARVRDGGHALLGAFHFFDRDRSGKLTYSEMASGLKKLAGIVLDDGTFAKLMEQYDPTRTGSINFEQFTRYVMGSGRGQGLGLPASSAHSKATSASSTWSIEQLERQMKSKIEKSWTQVQNAMHTADVDRSGSLDPTELRNVIEKFCFALPDSLFDQLYARLPKTTSGEIPLVLFTEYFRDGIESMEGAVLSPPTTAEQAAAFIASRIEENLPSGSGGLLKAYKMFDRDRSGAIEHSEFLEELRTLFLIRIDPELVPKLLKIYDPQGKGKIDYVAFATNVMGPATSIAGGSATSFGDRDRPVVDVQGQTIIPRHWGFEEVEGCLRRKLRGDRARRVVEALNSCDIDRSGYVHADELAAILRSERLAITAAQFSELLRNFPINAAGKLRWADFAAAFVSNASQDVAAGDVDTSGDRLWDNLSLEQVKSLIRQRVESRIGAGPDQYRRTWKYFSAGKEATLDLQHFTQKLRTDLNIHLSSKMLAELKNDLNDGSGDTVIAFPQFVTKLLGSTNGANLSIERIGGNADHISHLEGNSEMMIRRKVQESVHGLTAAFKRADVDCSGSLSPEQLQQILHRHTIDLTAAQYVTLLKAVDLNKDGRVSISEFLTHFQRQIRLPQIQPLMSIDDRRAVDLLLERCREQFSGQYGTDLLKCAFRLADTDRSGALSLRELSAAMTSVTNMLPSNQQLILLLERLDVDHSTATEIDYNEFCSKLSRGGAKLGTGIDTRSLGKVRTGHYARPSEAFERVPNPAEVDRLLARIAQRVKTQRSTSSAAFRAFDAAGSGRIGHAEFRRVLACLNLSVTVPEFEALCSKLDRDKTGTIPYVAAFECKVDKVSANAPVLRSALPLRPLGVNNSDIDARSDGGGSTRSRSSVGGQSSSSRASLRLREGKKFAAKSSKAAAMLAAKYAVNAPPPMSRPRTASSNVTS